MKHKKPFTLASLLLTILLGSTHAQELAPDDATIVANLGVWFRDAANTFDTETGIWADSSGNDNHAEPVGEVDVNGPVTYIGPTSDRPSGRSLAGPSLTKMWLRCTLPTMPMTC